MTAPDAGNVTGLSISAKSSRVRIPAINLDWMLDSNVNLRPCFPDYGPHGPVVCDQGVSHSELSVLETASLRQRGGISQGMPSCTRNSMRPQRHSIHHNHSNAMPQLCELKRSRQHGCSTYTDRRAAIQVLYHQCHSRNCRSGVWLGSSVQNGTPSPLLSAISILRISIF